MAIGGDDDLNEVSNPTYDELYDAFKDLHNELMKIGKKNVCLKKEMVKLKNENESLNAKITCIACDCLFLLPIVLEVSEIFLLSGFLEEFSEPPC